MSDSSEIWKPVVGYESLYNISNKGNLLSIYYRIKFYRGVESKKNEKLLVLSKDPAGYFAACLSKNGKIKRHSIHRLVAEAFIPNPENKPQVNHKNSIRTDNRVENLEWCTNKENSIHSVAFGFTKSGSHSRLAKLNEDDVRTIRMLQSTHSQSELSKMFKMSSGAIYNIIHYKTWKNVRPVN